MLLESTPANVRTVQLMISGALAMSYTIAALFFLKFWRRTSDRLFALFAASFALLAVQRLLLSFVTTHGGDTTVAYALRLAAFSLILWAIIEKNRSG